MQQDSFKTKIVRWVTAALLLVVVVGGLALAWPTYRDGRLLKGKSAEMDAQILAKRAEIAALKDRQRRFKTDRDFVEGVARQDHRVYPGELVFVFDKKGEPKKK